MKKETTVSTGPMCAPCPLSPLWLMPLALGCWAGIAGGQVAPGPVLTLRPAAEISMPTERGKIYQMQASPDLGSWQNHGDPIFGTGQPILQPMTGGTSRFFRLEVVTTPAMGGAPWSLEGTFLQLNEGSRTVRYQFQSNGSGQILAGTASRLITWTWLRNSLRTGRAELTLPDSTREVIDLFYTTSSVGQFVRRAYTGSRLDNTDAGSFGPVPIGTAPLVPSSVVGRAMAFSELPGGNGLTLTNAHTGERMMDGIVTTFNGNWLVTGSTTARLTANFGATHGEEYRFTFTSGLAGRYSRLTYTEGVFRDADEGNFCLGNAP